MEIQGAQYEGLTVWFNTLVASAGGSVLTPNASAPSLGTPAVTAVGVMRELRNLFVAGFIGSPAMNFLHATLEENALRTALGDLPLDDRVRQVLERENVPRELIVGFRPEDFEDAALVDAVREGFTFTVTVDVVESLGADVYVHFTEEGGPATTDEPEELAADSGLAETGSRGRQIVTRLDAATRAREGRPIELWLNAAKGHIFDPATGTNLTHPGIAGRSNAKR